MTFHLSLAALLLATSARAQVRIAEVAAPVSAPVAVAPLAAAQGSTLLPAGIGARPGLAASPFLTRVLASRLALARRSFNSIAAAVGLKPDLDRLFDLARRAAPAAEEPPPSAAPIFRHFDHADFADDSGFPSDDSGNPLVVPDHLQPLLPSAFDKATWAGRTTLHLHSQFSDGTMSPEDVIDAAFKAGVRSISLTDHDTVAGVRRAYAKAKELGMEFHPGAELSARGGVHIGAIDVDIFNPALVAALETMHELRWKKAEVILGNINKMPELKDKGIILTMAEVEAQSKHAEGGTIEIPHIARVLLEHRLIEHVDDAFNHFLKGDAFKGIEKYPDPSVDEVLSVIRKAGGKAILNHPYTVRDAQGEGGGEDAPRDAADSRHQDELIEAILEKGVDGIEVYRPVGAKSEEGKKRADARAAKYLLWVDKYSRDGKVLVAAPGSDYHGADTHLNRLAVWMPKPLAAQLQDSLREANAAALASLESHEKSGPPSPARASLAPMAKAPQPMIPWPAIVLLAAVGLASLALLILR